MKGRPPRCGGRPGVEFSNDGQEAALAARAASAGSFQTCTRIGARWLRFGTGAGITWHSDPAGEWAETELKAARLIGLAAGTVTP